VSETPGNIKTAALGRQRPTISIGGFS